MPSGICSIIFGTEVGAIHGSVMCAAVQRQNLRVLGSDSFSWDGSVVLSMAFMTIDAPVLNLSTTACSMIFVLMRKSANRKNLNMPGFVCARQISHNSL